MESKDFTVTILVQHSSEEVYKALLNVRGWWSGLYEESFEGSSEKTGDEFTFLAGGGAHFTKQKLVEQVPNKKLVWLVTESNLSFVDKANEWTGTRICFEIIEEGDKTKVVFTHVGLVPEFECYDSCAPAWTQYIVEKQLRLS
ncbi:MAG: SRPBCC domain-containing protein [Bacteroidetes bacterium]|nr:SRPBCC domain-containing protein [Bacteroidota bacterium]